MDNCAALEVKGARYRALVSRPGANVYRVYWLGKSYFRENLPKDGRWRPLADLLRKGKS